VGLLFIIKLRFTSLEISRSIFNSGFFKNNPVDYAILSVLYLKYFCTIYDDFDENHVVHFTFCYVT